MVELLLYVTNPILFRHTHFTFRLVWLTSSIVEGLQMLPAVRTSWEHETCQQVLSDTAATEELSTLSMLLRLPSYSQTDDTL